MLSCDSVQPPAEAPETDTSQKQGDSEKETIPKFLSILADGSELKYRFSQKWLAQF